MAVRKDVLDQIGESNNLSPDQAEAMLAYHQKIRSHLVDKYVAAQVSPDVELRKEAGTEIATATSSMFGFIPLVGPAIESLVNLFTLGLRSKKEATLREKNENYLDTIPAHDQKELAEFAKTFATQLSERKLSEIKELDPKEAKALALQDATNAIEEMSSGEYENISKKHLPPLLAAIAPEKEEPHQHQDLGKFTHAIIEKEESEAEKHAHEDSQGVIENLLKDPDAVADIEDITLEENHHFVNQVLASKEKSSDHVH